MDRRAFLAALAASLASPLDGSARPHPARGPLPAGWLPPGSGSPSGNAAIRSMAAPPGSGLHALILGTVQDAGLPQVGCYSERCEAGRALHREGRGRYVSSLALVEPEAERFYLVDATPDVTRQIDLVEDDGFRRRAGERRPFDGIFLTHAHIGHYTGLAVLGREGLGIRETPVFCTAAMARFLAGNAPWSLMVDERRIVPTPLETEREHRIDEHLAVTLLPVPHRDEFADTVGFVFRGPERSLLYLPDINAWRLWERDVAEVVAGVDVALLDGSFWSMDELPGRSVEDVPHPLIGTTMDRLQPVVDRGDARVLFTHLNNSNPALDEGGEERREVERRGFEVAREGMRLGL